MNRTDLRAPGVNDGGDDPSPGMTDDEFLLSLQDAFYRIQDGYREAAQEGTLTVPLGECHDAYRRAAEIAISGLHSRLRELYRDDAITEDQALELVDSLHTSNESHIEGFLDELGSLVTAMEAGLDVSGMDMGNPFGKQD